MERRFNMYSIFEEDLQIIENILMPNGDAYSSGHLVLSYCGTCKYSNVETNLSWTGLVSELVILVLNFVSIIWRYLQMNKRYFQIFEDTAFPTSKAFNYFRTRRDEIRCVFDPPEYVN